MDYAGYKNHPRKYFQEAFIIMIKQFPNSPLVLFDFDGTLTQKDTLFEIIKFDKGIFHFILGMIVLSPYFIAFVIGKCSSQFMKEKFLKYFLKNRSIENWNDTCDLFSKKVIPGLIRPEALKVLEEHKRRKSRIIVVTASIENWVRPWCMDQDIECIGSRLEVSEGKISGKLMGINCNGEEKVRRIKEFLNLETYGPIYAYGDSKGDIPMLKLADYAYFKKLEFVHE